MATATESRIEKKTGKPAIDPSQSVHWCTPEWVLEDVRAVLDTIELDPCSNPYSTVGALTSYLLPTNDGLKDSWDFETIFCNPPYGRGLIDWVRRCADANAAGSEVLLIIPAATETKHWQNIIYPTAAAVCYYNKRVKFEPNELTPNVKDQPTKGHAMIYWGTNTGVFVDVFGKRGHVEVLDRK